MDLLYTQNTNVIGHNVRPRPPLDHITSKIARTRAKFANFVAPALNKFPWKFSNETVADRLRTVLKLIVEGKEIEEWLTIIKNTVGTSDVIETRMAGSTSVATVYLPYLNYVTEKSELEDREELKKEFKKKEFHTSDVDMKIRVKSGASLNKLLNHKEWCVKYSDQNVIILAIGEGKKQRLDVVVFKTLKADFAFYGDDLTISLDATDLKTNTVIVSSKYPWEWLRAQAFGLIGNGGRRVHELFPRLLGKLLKGEVCTDNMEVELFNCWVTAYYNFKAQKKPDPLNYILNKQWEDHESGVVLSRYLLALRLQQLILTYSNDKVLLKEAASIYLQGEVPAWIKFAFKAMNTNENNIELIHKFIQRLGLIALSRGWEHPFQAKIIWHGGEQVLRLRVRGDFGKKDLLLKFNLKDLLDTIDETDSEILRGFLQSLSIDGIRLREMSEDYKKSLADVGLNSDAVKKLRKSFQYVDMSVDTFLHIFTIDDIEDKSLSEEMLFRIIQANPKILSEWIQKMDRPEFKSPEYTQAISNLICEIPHLFKMEWILAFLSSERFTAKKHPEDQLCAFFFSKNAGVLNKIKSFEIRQFSFSLFSSLFRAISPWDECYQKWWVEKALKDDSLLEHLEQSQYQDCLRLVKGKEDPILEKMIATKRGIEMIVDFQKSVTPKLLYKMTQNAVKIDDGFEMVEKVFAKFKNCMKDNKHTKLLTELATKMLMQPGGNFNLVLAISDFFQMSPIREHLPDADSISKLIKGGHFDWIYKMLEETSPEDLNKLTPDVYSKILNATKDVEKKAKVLQKCLLVSEKIQFQWEACLQDAKLNIDVWSRLCMHGQVLQIPVEKIAGIVMTTLPKYAKIAKKLDRITHNYFIKLITELDVPFNYAFWMALYKSKKVNIEHLWDSGFALLKKFGLVPLEQYNTTFAKDFPIWMEQNSKRNNLEQLREILRAAAIPIRGNSLIRTVRSLKNSTSKAAVWVLENPPGLDFAILLVEGIVTLYLLHSVYRQGNIARLPKFMMIYAALIACCVYIINKAKQLA